MCGICGFVNLDRRDPANAAVLERMRDSIRHRGPDDAGVLIDGPVALGHRRLSIIDLTGGHQPMSNEDGRYGSSSTARSTTTSNCARRISKVATRLPRTATPR